MEPAEVRDEQTMAVYPIRTVAKLTGVSEGALRSWELRYQVICPARTSGGHRLFSRSDINRILQIKHLLQDEGIGMAGVRSILAGQGTANHG